MKTTPVSNPLPLATKLAMAVTLLGTVPAWAQTPPIATNTFNVASGNWDVGGNWQGGLPTGASNAWIGQGNTVALNTGTMAPAYGTLTLDTNSTINLTTTGGNNIGGLLNVPVYFKDGSHLNYVSGFGNADQNYSVVSGATATMTLNSGHKLRGTLTGGGNLNVVLKGNIASRLNNTLAGNLTFSSNTTAGRLLAFEANTAGQNHFGAGTTTIGDYVYFTNNAAEKIDNNGTLKLVGGTGGNNTKWAVHLSTSSAPTETISNLIIDSPASGTAPYITTGTSANAGGVRITNTLTFQGTAGTIDIRNKNTAVFNSLPRADQDDLAANNITFASAGNWAITGSKDGGAGYAIGTISVRNGGTITTVAGANATISSGFGASSGFTKAGDGSLTIAGPIVGVNGTSSVAGTISVQAGKLVMGSNYGGTINVTGGELVMSGSLGGLSVQSGGALTIGSALTAGDVLNLGASNLSLGDGAIINWQFSDLSTFDSISSSGSLDLTSITNVIINGTNLGIYNPQLGDSFTLFSGTVTAFDPGKFTLNLPELDSGLQWSVAEGSLLLEVIAVPEPSALLLGGLGLIGLAIRRRR